MPKPLDPIMIAEILIGHLNAYSLDRRNAALKIAQEYYRWSDWKEDKNFPSFTDLINATVKDSE